MVIDIRFTTERAPIQIQRVYRVHYMQHAPGEKIHLSVYTNTGPEHFPADEIAAFLVFND